MYPHLTNTRSSIADQFYALQSPARRDAIWATLFGQSTKLALFPEEAPEKSPNRKFIGLQEIPVDQIVGTLNRGSDFDYKFRPLKSYLRDRWINVYLSLGNGDLPPIVVHKVGEQYYVEDGHHRVSVMRFLGRMFIQAKVWEYPVQILQEKKCKPEACVQQRKIEAYAAD